MPTTKASSRYTLRFSKPRRRPVRAKGPHLVREPKRSETWDYGVLSRPKSRKAESWLEKCGHLFHLAWVYAPGGHYAPYDKGIDAANHLIPASFPPAEILMLEQMADTGKAHEFETLARALQWSAHRPSHLAKVVDMALALGLIPLARELARCGTEAFPGNSRLKQAARILSPGIAAETQPARPLRMDASQHWLKEHAAEHKGQWVAVLEGALLATAPTLKQLHRQIGERKDAALIVKVLPETAQD